jgi:hypothetical protein
MSRKPNSLVLPPGCQPWIEAERLWEKPHPGLIGLDVGALASDPGIQEGRRLWADDNNAAWRNMLAAPSVAAAEQMLKFYPSEQRGDATLFIFTLITGRDIFWPLVARNWSAFDAIDHAAFAKAFKRRRRARTSSCMLQRDLDAYNGLTEDRAWIRSCSRYHQH